MTVVNTKKDPARLTIENCERLAKKIVAKYGMPMSDAMDLAEFNLKYAANYAEAAKRV